MKHSDNERSRLAALRSYRVLDTPREVHYDWVVQLAADLFNVPMAAMTLIDEDRQWFKAEVGIGVNETPRGVAFCTHTIEQPNHILVVEDATQDARFRENPFVTGDPHVRFYAGVALHSASGHNLGALCVIDTKPMHPSEAMLAQLRVLARLAVAELELSRTKAANTEKARLLDLAEHMSGVGHWRYEPGSGDIAWSAEVYRIHGVTPETFNPQLDDAIAFYHPEDQKHIRDCVETAIVTGNGYEFKRRLTGRDGILRHVTGKAICELDSTGKVVALSGVFQDISEHVRVLDAANAATAVKAEFLANMSHELRTPLTSIIGFAELLKIQPGLTDKTSSYVDRVINGSQALLATVNDVLDFSKLEAGQVEIRPRATSSKQILNDSVDLFAPQADAKGLEVVLTIAPNVPETILTDPDRLRQILLNLIGNAVKFTAKGRIAIDVGYEPPSNLIVSVSDTGPGISPAQIGRLFQRFSQVDGSLSRAHGGTGLGLAICKGLIEAMSGSIQVESSVGVGSTFRLRLPSPKVAAATKVVERSATVLSLDEYRILAVDDNLANRALVSASLQPTGAELTVASGGQEAIDIAGRLPFDLILLDLHMPAIDGYAALKAIRGGAGPNCAVPILAFTAEADASEMRALLAAGFDGVVSKPILPTDLIRQIAAKFGGPLLANPPARERASHPHA